MASRLKKDPIGGSKGDDLSFGGIVMSGLKCENFVAGERLALDESLGTPSTHDQCFSSIADALARAFFRQASHNRSVSDDDVSQRNSFESSRAQYSSCSSAPSRGRPARIVGKSDPAAALKEGERRPSTTPVAAFARSARAALPQHQSLWVAATLALRMATRLALDQGLRLHHSWRCLSVVVAQVDQLFERKAIPKGKSGRDNPRSETRLSHIIDHPLRKLGLGPEAG